VSWPSAEQRLLLRALFGPAGEARSAYASWRGAVSFDPLEVGSIPLMPLLYFRLRELGVDDPLLPLLKGAYKKHCARNLLLVSRAAQASGLLAGAGIPSLAFGGLAALPFYAERVGCRPLEDGGDLLVEGSSLPAARDLLQGGFAGVNLIATDGDRLAALRARGHGRELGGHALACASALDLLAHLLASAARRGLSRDLLWVADAVHITGDARFVDWGGAD